MSPLTKLFVVLNVLFSIALTAAIVVYVNKEDVQQNALKSALADRDAARAQALTAQQQLQATRENFTALQQQSNAQANKLNAQIVADQQQIGTLNTQLAQATSNAAAQTIDVSRLTEALNASQSATNQFQTQVASLRTNNDKLVQQSADLNGRVSDLTNKLDVTEKQRRHLAEQLTQTSATNDRLSKIINGAHLTPEQQQMAVNRSGLPAISGTVRDVRNIAGVDYATISVGSADGVQQGMEFKVVNSSTGDFLGTITINTVDPNESTGRLAGPNVAAIKPGVEVKTQL